MHNWHTTPGQVNTAHHLSYLNDWRSDSWKVDNQTKHRVKDLFVFTCTAMLLQWQPTHSTLEKCIMTLKSSKTFSYYQRPTISIISNCVIQTIYWGVSALHATKSEVYFCMQRDQPDNDTNNGNQKGLPTSWIVSKIVTDDIISSQTANSWYQWWKNMLIGLADISLKNEANRWAHLPRHAGTLTSTHLHIFSAYYISIWNFVSTYLTSIVVNGTMTESVSTFLNWMPNLEEKKWKHTHHV